MYDIVQIISEYKKIRGGVMFDNRGNKKFVPAVYPKKGFKRVEAIIRQGDNLFTKHIDIKK